MRLSEIQKNILGTVFVHAHTKKGTVKRLFPAGQFPGKPMNKLIQLGLIRFDSNNKDNGYFLTREGLSLINLGGRNAGG